MMKTRIHTLLPAALLLLATACEDTLTAPGNPATGNGPTLTLALDNREDNGQTRSELTDGAPVNHVQSVRILVFKGEGDDATYEGEEIYTGANKGAIAWPTPTEEGQEKPDQIIYQMNYPFVEDETYTLLGVGQDEQFATTYDLIDNNDKNDIEQGTTLTNAYAKLKENASPKECDFYTGTTTFTYEGRDTHIDDLRMKRRVAGVLLYVTEIPQSLTDENNNNNYRITSIRVCLGEIVNQNSSVRLQRDFENWNEEPAGQDKLDGSNVIAEITGLENWTYTDRQDFYMEDGSIKTARTGVYMLPLNATEGTPTFTVKMYGKKLSSDATGGATEGEEKELKSFTVEQRDTDGESVTSFPIRSNYLYSIGKYNPEEGVDEPISLSGDPIYLEVLPFDELEVSHDFGEAPVQALFNPDFDEETKIFNCMNGWVNIKILPPLITIRENVTQITATIIEDDPIEGDREGEKYLRHWLYMREHTNDNRESDTYTQNNLVLYSSESDQPMDWNNMSITLFMEDYARRRTWGWTETGTWSPTDNDIKNIQDDVRNATVILTTTIQQDEQTIERTDVLHIKQYNTITVRYQGRDEVDNDELENAFADCGFSREDMTIDEEGNLFYDGWGFWDTNNISIYSGDGIGSRGNGSWNLENIQANSGWTGTAVIRAQYTFKEIQTEGTDAKKMRCSIRTTDKDSRTNTGWYLPAEFEMEGLMVLSADCSDKGYNTSYPNLMNTITNLTYDRDFWTSTTAGIYSTSETDRNKKSYAYEITKSNDSDYSWQRNKFIRDRNNNDVPINKCYIRQARKFSDKYNGQW